MALDPQEAGRVFVCEIELERSREGGLRQASTAL